MSVLQPKDWRLDNDAVYYTDCPLAGIDESAVAFLRQAVGGTPRQRIRVCTHLDPQADFHEMLIALGEKGYVRPHHHHHRAESIHVIDGLATLVLFETRGRVQQSIRLAPYGQHACWYYRLGEPVYHTLLPETSTFVFHESTTGPFRPEDTQFAPWAPGDADSAAVRDYLTDLRQEVGAMQQG